MNRFSALVRNRLQTQVGRIEAHTAHTTYRISCELKCDVCDEAAKYRAVSVFGTWGCFCAYHWRTHTPAKLGLGMGQKFIKGSV